ncbi:MAG: DegT/DnrJ/EryC1/StrS aminotransferase family protein [Desulfobacteraceae bacterium]|nr:DegT/DnrJ/EryC1/StrS aminotransferase family protein [Desulfobacteraceae bacterium]
MSDSSRRQYERVFAAQVGAAGARAFGLGRQGLVVLLKALGVNEGDKIGVCSFTCLSVIEAVKVCGAIPEYLDVDEYLCIEPAEIQRQKPGCLKAVILQHTFGIPGRLDELLSACRAISVTVVEDCAHSLGCYWAGRPLGSFAAGAIYSFQWGKPYTTGQGGIATVNSEKLSNELDQQIEQWALSPSKKSELILQCERWMYSLLERSTLVSYLRYVYSLVRDVGLVKGSFQLDSDFHLYRGYVRLAGEATAKAGVRQLRDWPRLKHLRRKNAKMIEDYFSKAGLAPWPRPEKADVTMLRYPLLVPDKERILRLARKRGLDIAGWYISPVHPAKGEQLAKLDYHKGSCPKAENMIERLVHLPTGLALNEPKLAAMLEIICGG